MRLQAWRLVQARWAATAFSGDGAQRHGGRWNHPGTALVYTSGTLSLAALEVLANLRRPEILWDFVALPATFDAALCLQLPTEELLPGWNGPTATRATRDIGTRWAQGLSSVALAVPSVVVSIESNYLLNPTHPDFERVAIGSPEPFQLDARLFGEAS